MSYEFLKQVGSPPPPHGLVVTQKGFTIEGLLPNTEYEILTPEDLALLRLHAGKWRTEMRLRRTRHLRRQEKRKRMNALVKAELAEMVERGKPHLQPRENES